MVKDYNYEEYSPVAITKKTATGTNNIYSRTYELLTERMFVLRHSFLQLQNIKLAVNLKRNEKQSIQRQCASIYNIFLKVRNTHEVSKPTEEETEQYMEILVLLKELIVSGKPVHHRSLKTIEIINEIMKQDRINKK